MRVRHTLKRVRAENPPARLASVTDMNGPRLLVVCCVAVTCSLAAGLMVVGIVEIVGRLLN